MFNSERQMSSRGRTFDSESLIILSTIIIILPAAWVSPLLSAILDL